MKFSRFKLNNLKANELLALAGGAGMGVAGAVGSAQEGDPIGTTALKALASGGAGALAGKYAAPLGVDLAKGAAGAIKRGAVDLGSRLQGTGALTAAVGVPAVLGAGALAYQGARAVNVPLDVAKTPGFQNAQSVAVNQANAAYEQMIQQEMEMAYLNQPINPEQAGLSSNTLDARMGMG